MRVIKKINNNVAICADNHNHELIAFGKGIGFPSIPYELTDLSKIDRTFYGVSSIYFNLLKEIDEDVVEVSAKIVDIASTKFEYDMNSNIVFTLADHIQFAIQRFKQKIYLRVPFSYDIQHLYEEEMLMGESSLEIIRHYLGVQLPKEEAAGIALHFVNSQQRPISNYKETDETTIIKNLALIIEKDFNIEINKNGFNYSRFVSHMEYLLKRKDQQKDISSSNKKLFETVKKEFKEVYICSLHCHDYLSKQLKWQLSDEELLYLMLHINRLCSREDCNH